MEALISAVVSDLVGRAISTMVEKHHEQVGADKDAQRLHRLLMRIRTVVEEAEGRSVVNRAMIHQVGAMREQMFRGHYLLDAFRGKEKKTGEEEEASRSSFAPSEINPAKRFCRLSSNTTQVEGMLVGGSSSKDLKQAILGLENMVANMKEFAVFLMSYPQISRQPQSTYLLLDKCMFGRHMEKEQTISFLLQAEPLGSGILGVLPIVGPAFIGKSTLVEHVCYDERVRTHFSLILLYSGNDLKDETLTTFRDNCVIKHQNIASDEERSLVVIELLRDADPGAWKRLLQSSKRCMTHGSKIIITSRSEKVVSFGTTEAVKLKCLPKEAYWYFFKTLVFGSTDPEEHPKLTSIGMELALEMRGSFINAYIATSLLRANLNARFWCSVLTHFREYIQKNTLLFGEYPENHRPRYIWSMTETRPGSEDPKFFLLADSYQKRPAAHGEVPQIAMVDLLSGTGSARPRGRFDVLYWRSLIPPYYSYGSTCEFVPHKNTNAYVVGILQFSSSSSRDSILLIVLYL